MTPPNDIAAASGNDVSGAAASGGPPAVELPIVNKRGLHARASAKFVQLVEKFDATVSVTRNGETVGGNSIMGLMMLSAGIGTSIVVSAAGPQAREAIEAITALVSSKFGEDE